MNLDSWNRLPPDIKKILENDIEFWGLETDKDFNKTNQEGAAYGKKMGVEFRTMPKEKLTKLNVPMKELATKEAKDLDAKGCRAQRYSRKRNV
jgi:TRAP-type C4-dicarboxylate transport system substrate-binding protein